MTDSQQPDEATTPEAPVAQPAAPSPAAFAARPKPAAAPVAPQHTADVAVDLVAARAFGRVEGDGHVFVTVDGEEHVAGQYPGVSAEEALAYFARKYEDIVAQIALLESRVEAKATGGDLPTSLKHLREQLEARNVLGDIRGALDRVSALEGKVSGLLAEQRAEHEAAKAEQQKIREDIVAEAEAISGQDPAATQWKTSSTRMNELFDAWKAAQKSGVRLPKSVEENLWKRFRGARTVFDRHRRAYFSQLDSANAQAKSVKEALIAEAEKLQNSTDWGAVAAEYRHLMDQWKAAPRASRKEDDTLWARFRAAQDVFFNARQSATDEVEAGYASNLAVKEQLLLEAQGIVPVSDLAAAKKALQSIRDRWEEAGRVPRADMGRIEAAMRRVEDAVREAEEENWRRSDPEAKARSNSMIEQLEATIAGLRDDLDRAEAKGDARAVKSARDALEAREQWLDVVRQSAKELG
ncbi:MULTISPECIES: DUF349 domain-containing protein [Arthrobacter]|uniref:DUF349 domain-containing protein n=2 Tax=Arthrobacter TaxID=1663 RepID=A0ABU9KGR6_9MICC|nr:DUF349 domain-containing protein [Arthrobacter sp. YJM1]MDP5226069.1 DUF349 domain-containing protein [Arthrobacter sp. YJM1]